VGFEAEKDNRGTWSSFAICEITWAITDCWEPIMATVSFSINRKAVILRRVKM
jgi:hypothetical protein